MNTYSRKLQLPDLLKKNSFFLFGPRATGKSFLIKTQLDTQAIVLNLLRAELFLTLSASPWKLEAIIEAEQRKYPDRPWVVIDEVQKAPPLLDEVHRLIEEKGIRFLLTGSSARKLKRGGANMLAGRAWTAHLHPLCYAELPDFDLDHYLRWGGLPIVHTSETPHEELQAYVQTYLHEEILAEGLVRRLPPFARFLTAAAFMNGHLLNFAKISSDIAVPASTIREYYAILEDTLLGFSLTPWAQASRKAIATAKFYFFDTGIVHALAGTQTVDRNSDLYGRAFEHWIALELRSFLHYTRLSDTLSFWRDSHQNEVDFIIGDHTAIEVKATTRVTPKDLKGLRILQTDSALKKYFLVSHDTIETVQDQIHCIHWKTFLDFLW